MDYLKILSSKNETIKCMGNINFLDDYPLLFFDCNLIAENKREFLKKFFIKIKNKNENIELQVKGNLSVLNNKNKY